MAKNVREQFYFWCDTCNHGVKFHVVVPTGNQPQPWATCPSCEKPFRHVGKGATGQDKFNKLRETRLINRCVTPEEQKLVDLTDDGIDTRARTLVATRGIEWLEAEITNRKARLETLEKSYAPQPALTAANNMLRIVQAALALKKNQFQDQHV